MGMADHVELSALVRSAEQTASRMRGSIAHYSFSESARRAKRFSGSASSVEWRRSLSRCKCR